jgi:hypothetical protein
MHDKADQLPDNATKLIALARVAHRNGDRRLEQAARDMLTRQHGITVEFPCCRSVEDELAGTSEVPT